MKTYNKEGIIWSQSNLQDLHNFWNHTKPSKPFPKTLLSHSFQCIKSLPQLYLYVEILKTQIDSFRIRTDICCLLFDSFQNWVSILAICAWFCHLFEAVVRLSDRNNPAIFSRKVDAIPNQQSRPPLLSLPEVIRPIFSHYWTIDVNLPNLMCSALSRYSYKKTTWILKAIRNGEIAWIMLP